MRQFRCENCGLALFFGNDRCGRCDARVGFIAPEGRLAAFREEPDGRYVRYAPSDHQWRRCANYASACLCNWMVADDDPNDLCRSCRLTLTIPDQSFPENRAAWLELESAKRTWLYTILSLRLPAQSRLEDPSHGLAFHFLKQVSSDQPVMTGHQSGEITINIDESDPVKRESNRHALHEPYRTVLGHFRHESGHYYWERLVRDSARLEPFREMFGDEREDYGQALQRHYEQGPPSDWLGGFVSGYAAAHPWEDWAETWAHYLHMVDLLDTARSWKLSIGGFADQYPEEEKRLRAHLAEPFARMVEEWVPLTLLANSLSRCLGHADAYPFALSYRALQKVQFVHEVVSAA